MRLKAETITPPTTQGPGPGPDGLFIGGGGGGTTTPHNAGEIIDADNTNAIATDLMAMTAPVQICCNTLLNWRLSQAPPSRR